MEVMRAHLCNLWGVTLELGQMINAIVQDTGDVETVENQIRHLRLFKLGLSSAVLQMQGPALELLGEG